MRIVFFGTPEWAVPSLEALAAASHDIPLVVTQPARRRGRGSASSPSPVGATAGALGLPILEPDSVRSPEVVARLADAKADLFVVVAYGKIFPQALLDLPGLGALNVHFSLLPRYRGAAPVQWALANGETTTGATTMRMVRALDAGPVYLQEPCAIAPGEHAPALGARLARIGAALLAKTIDGLASGNLAPREQEPVGATLAPMLTRKDGQIDWRCTAQTIAQRIAGFDPWPGQSARARKGVLRLLEARARALPAGAPDAAGAAGEHAPSGTILGVEGRALLIACAVGTVLEATRVQPEARSAMSGADAVRGLHLAIGEQLVEDAGKDA